ncbi:MAG TPA: ABC transporter permease [Euzebyales bacterium]|nr:ABC transporter permease [Euzebyales bacterium]
MTTTANPTVIRAQRASVWRCFLSILARDLYVTGKELPSFLAQVVLQPFFFVFVFGKVLGNLGFTQGGYADILLPGIIAMTVVLTALQSTAFPLVIEFSFTKEIEDRLLAPLPTSTVAIEKIVFAALRGVLAGAVMFPIGWLVLGRLNFDVQPLALVVFLVVGALAGSCLGLVMGTLVPPNRISVMFSLVLTPLLFTGAAMYPWATLDQIRWFQIVTLFNPLTYMSEGIRAALIPDVVPHLHTGVAAAVLTGATLLAGTIGIRGFLRRAID